MEQLASVLEISNALDYIAFDFTLASHMNYYTGMLFEVFAENSSYSIGNGGRYNGLLADFGQAESAVGFALKIDELLEAMPTYAEEKTKVLVLYVSTQLAQALKETAKLRNQGIYTTMQSIEGITDLASYEKQFSQVIRIGQGGASYE